MFLCHTETVCDHHLQQAHSGADGLPHRVSKPQRVCVCTCVRVFAHQKYLVGCAAITHERVNAELDG